MDISLHSVEGRHWAALPGAPSAIAGLSLSAVRGEQIAVIGPSGAGKTTLLQMLALALKPASGHLTLDGENPWMLATSRLQKLRGQIFYAPQTPPLPPRQRVVTSLLAGRLPALSLMQSLLQLIYPSNLDQAVTALSAFDLSEKLWERVDRLSGGERQRVGLARALMSPAECWLIDEPLSALDPTRAKLAMDTLVSEARRRNVTLIVTLHQVDVATSRFPRVIGLRDGKCAFDLPAAHVTRTLLGELYAQHEHELANVAAPQFDLPAEPAQAKIVHCR